MPQGIRYIVGICVLVLALASCTGDKEPNEHYFILAIDRTGSTAEADTWATEVATQTQTAMESAVSDGADQVELLGLGSNTEQAATVASADLAAIEGNTEAKREESRQRLIDDIASAAAQVAAVPVESKGTDVFAAFQQAASLCQTSEVSECSLLMFSDLEDQRLLALSSADAAVQELAHLMPDLSGVSVHVSGLGASGADAETVHKVKAAWELLLDHAGTADVRIARSL